MYVFMLLIYSCYQQKELVCIDQHEYRYLTPVRNVVLKCVVSFMCIKVIYLETSFVF